MKAFLGMGLLGSGFTRAMLQKGDQVQVWNRTESKATALRQYGAKVFSSPDQAVKGASIVHICLKDDETVDAVLAAAEPGLSPGTIIIDHTTTSLQGAADRTRNWTAKGFPYQHAPVFMGPSNALDSTGHMLVSGDQTLIKQLDSELSKMTGKVLNFGDEPGKAAGMKLLGNAFLICFTMGISDTLALAKSLQIPTSDLTKLFTEWNPGTGTPGRLARMLTGDYDNPSWELNMARKDTRLFIEASHVAGVELTLIPTIAKEMDKSIAEGNGNKDWFVITKDSLA
jgi:3-hydroxyisobutyrate dehydrogenase